MRRIVLGALALGLAGCETLGMRDRSDLVVDPQVCVHTTLPVYFAEGEAGLTDPARETIESAAQTLGHCSIQAVRVIGLASATGSAAQNLSRQYDSRYGRYYYCYPEGDCYWEDGTRRY